MSASGNQLRLLKIIQSRKETRINDLVEILGVTRRSVFRYLNDLQESGIQIFWSPDSGYYLPKGVSVPALEFNATELTTILAGLAFLKSQDDSSLTEPASRLERRILGQLPADTKSYFESVKNAFTVNPNHSDSVHSQEETWLRLADSIASYSPISFHYVRQSDKKRERRAVNPYQLIFYFDHWTLLGYDTDRQDLRSFVVDNISEIKTEQGRFERPADLKTLIFRSSQNSKLFTVEVQTSALKNFLRSFTAPIVSRETKIQSTEITFRFDNESYLNTWLLQFGDQIRILSPETLIDARKKLLSKLLAEQ